MSSIKLKHASGNGVIIAAPSSNPAADRTLTLPSDADGIIAKTDASGNLTVSGDLTVDTSTLKVDSSNNRVYVGNTGLGATAAADDLVVGNLTGGHGITIHSQNNEGGFICFGDADTTGVDSRRGVIRYQHSDDSMRFGLAGNNEKMRILANGGITFNGDTAAANALDDYEEGTFSPTFGASNGSSTTTYTAQQGSYTKIGNRVFFNVYIKVNSISTGSHSVTNIGNLPFTNAGNRVSIHSIRSSGFQGSGDDSRPFAGTVEASSTVIELQKATDGGTNDFTTNQAQANSRVFIAGQYPIS